MELKTESLDRVLESLKRALEHGELVLAHIQEHAPPEARLETLLAAWWQLKEYNKVVDRIKKDLNVVLESYERSTLPGLFEKRGEDRVRLPAMGRSFGVIEKYSAKQLDKEEGFKWLRDRGDGDLITETVNAQTLASYLKDLLLDEGVEAPEGTFELLEYSAINSAKYTPKKTVAKARAV